MRGRIRVRTGLEQEQPIAVPGQRVAMLGNSRLEFDGRLVSVAVCRLVLRKFLLVFCNFSLVFCKLIVVWRQLGRLVWDWRRQLGLCDILYMDLIQLRISRLSQHRVYNRFELVQS